MFTASVCHGDKSPCIHIWACLLHYMLNCLNTAPQHVHGHTPSSSTCWNITPAPGGYTRVCRQLLHACSTDRCLAGSATRTQSSVQPTATSQVCHCEHRYLRRAPLCVSGGQQASAAWSTDARRQACCLCSRCLVWLQPAEQVSLAFLPPVRCSCFASAQKVTESATSTAMTHHSTSTPSRVHLQQHFARLPAVKQSLLYKRLRMCADPLTVALGHVCCHC